MMSVLVCVFGSGLWFWFVVLVCGSGLWFWFVVCVVLVCVVCVPQAGEVVVEVKAGIHHGILVMMVVVVTDPT
jgi:hypothetical protein